MSVTKSGGDEGTTTGDYKSRGEEVLDGVPTVIYEMYDRKSLLSDLQEWPQQAPLL